MRRLAALGAVTALSTVLAPVSARADYFVVRLEMVDILSHGEVAAVRCVATAETSAAGYVAATTTVGCRVDERTVTVRAAGPAAAAVAADEVGPSYLACISGAATFVSVSGRVSVTAPEQCTAYDH